MGLSNLGIFHTVIGIIAIVSAIVSYIKFGKINLAVLSGKIYFYCTVVTALTALGISKHDGFNPGHVLSILILVLVLLAYFLYLKKIGNNRSRHFENFCLSFSFFLSCIPTVNETLTRIPIKHPLAKDISDPLIGKTLLILLALFIVGSVFQFLKQKKINITANP
jgi:O-antigen ligase